MVKYRPHRGSLAEAMEEEQCFNSIEEMFKYIVKDWNKNMEVFTIKDLSISNDAGRDERINWKESRYVCTKRMYEKIYDTPQCIGMCSIED